MEIIASVDFNRDEDIKEFGCQRRVIDIDLAGKTLTISFEMGRKEDDAITLLLDWQEFILKIGKLF